MSMRIIGYTYMADMHCPACTRQDTAMRRLTLPKPVPVSSLDEHGLSDALIDGEGNPIHPVFDISEDAQHLTHCGDCRQELS